MNLTSARWTFWLTTTLFCAAMAVSAVLYLTNAGFKERFAHLGFPSYFRVELAIFKLAGVFALLLPDEGMGLRRILHDLDFCFSSSLRKW